MSSSSATFKTTSTTTSIVADSNSAIQAEIHRLQQELLNITPSAIVEEKKRHPHVGVVEKSHSSSSSASTRRPVDPFSIQSWYSDPLTTFSTARSQVREREQKFRASVTNTLQVWLLLILRTVVLQYEVLNSSWIMSELMTIPHLRNTIVFAVTTTLSIVSFAVNTRVFRWLPFSDIMLALVHDSELTAVFQTIPSLPVSEIKPYTQGPLRPFFWCASFLPFSSWFFTLNDPRYALLSIEQPVVAALLTSLKNQTTLIDYLQEDRRMLQETIQQMRTQLDAMEERVNNNNNNSNGSSLNFSPAHDALNLNGTPATATATTTTTATTFVNGNGTTISEYSQKSTPPQQQRSGSNSAGKNKKDRAIVGSFEKDVVVGAGATVNGNGEELNGQVM